MFQEEYSFLQSMPGGPPSHPRGIALAIDSRRVFRNINQCSGTSAVGMAFNLSNSLSTFFQASGSLLVANPFLRSA